MNYCGKGGICRKHPDCSDRNCPGLQMHRVPDWAEGEDIGDVPLLVKLGLIAMAFLFMVTGVPW